MENNTLGFVALPQTGNLPFFRLPVRPESPFDDEEWNGGDVVGTAYLTARERFNSGYLRKYVNGWRAIWEMVLPGEKLSSDERDLIAGRYSAKKLFHAYLRVQVKKTVKRPRNRYERMAVHLALPRALLRSFLLAEYYGVTVNLALVRTYVHTHEGFKGWGF